MEQYYPESGPGQQEISIGFTHALEAADQQILFRETVRAVAGRHQRRASFVPKLFADQAGSGCHVHLSLWRNGRNVLPDTDHPGQLSSVARCFQASNLTAVFLDDGFLPDTILPRQWHRRFVPVRRIRRLEHLAEKLLETDVPFDGLLDGFRRQIDPPPAGTVALKSIAAYRSGLAISPVSLQEARNSFNALKESSAIGGRRLSAKPLIDFLVMESMTLAARHRLPIQFHTGFGDPDLDLRNSNPLHLRWLLEAPDWREVPVVLLHAGYPFVREAGYLAAVYPQVYVDIGLTVPFVSIAGMQTVLQQLLELAPKTKLLFSSDAHLTPELFYLGTKWGREALAHVLEASVLDGDLTASEADSTAERILHANARRLYSISCDESPFPDPLI